MTKWLGKLARDQRGVSLVLVLCILVVFGTLGLVTHSLVTTDLDSSVKLHDSSQAFWAAEAGIELACRFLRYANPPPGGTQPFVQFDRVPCGQGHFTVTIDPNDNNPNTYLKAYTVTSLGVCGEARRAIRVELGMKTFSHYAYCTNSEGSSTIWFVTGDVIEGPLHSNDRIAIYSRPVFLGPVTSAATSFRKGAAYNPDFRSGYQLGVPPIAFPTFQDVTNNYWALNTDPPEVVLDARFSRHASVTLNADGTITYSVWHSTSSGIVYDLAPTTRPVSDLRGILFVQGDVEISGTLDGQLTVVATELIRIVDDLRYAASDASGRPAEGCDDLLGLISGGDVVVADTPPNRNDVVIDASILALGNSFTVENYNSGSARGYLRLWGSLAQKVRGPVGTFGYGGSQTGYLKDYHYDLRLLNVVPPYYPSTGQYRIYSWQEVDAD
ncbi:MAG: DUF4900 domain-containing protein [candidate division KSB1 bacterium]|nr:DUF4900 domain-containing protein [candidate division KSB1 bacterium]